MAGSARRRILWTVVGCFALLTAACTQFDKLVNFEPSTESVFSDVYHNLAERYIEPVNLRTSTVSGLARLSELDPELTVSVNDGSFSLLRNKVLEAQWETPVSPDPNSWASLTAKFLASARANSYQISSRPLEEIYSIVFKGVMSDLDRYSRYSGAKATRQRKAAREGFGGLGVSINLKDGLTRVVKVYGGTPASRAGILPNDVITHVGDKPLKDLDQTTVVGLLRGPLKSHADLTIKRPRITAPLTISVVRALIVIPTVTARREGDLLIVAISGFNQGTSSSARRTIRRAMRIGKKRPRGIVLDLRGNPGGLLDQSIQVADLFLDDGLILSTKGRHRGSDQVFNASRGDIARNVPIVVLVNGRSASASEIVAAALWDRGRAVLVGSSSYGKGTVQTIVGLANGGELTLTWAQMFSPVGYRLQDRGVIPAICTNGSGAHLDELRKSLRSRENRGRRAIMQNLRRRARGRQKYESLRAACPPDVDEPKTDLEFARILISNDRLYKEVVATRRPSIARHKPPPQRGHLTHR